jgi:chitin deacetylase
LLLVFLLSVFFLHRLSKSTTFQFFGEIINRVDTNQKVVALTLDDAPKEYSSDEVLKILAEKNIKATFYVTGKSMEKYPEETKRIVENGHELGNHSFSHERFFFKTQSYIQDEIEKTNQLIRGAGYVGEITFRPP